MAARGGECGECGGGGGRGWVGGRWGSGSGLGVASVPAFSAADMAESLLSFGPSYKMNTSPLALFLLFIVDFGLCWRIGGWGGTLRCFAVYASHVLVCAPDYRRRAG